MAKSKAGYWLTEEGLMLLGGWARDGYTDEEIAGMMGVAPSTLYLYMKQFSEISETIRYNKSIIDYEVEQALLKKALSGDTKAQVFWLSNRKNRAWRLNPDNARDDSQGEEQGVIVLPEVAEQTGGVDL